MSCPVDTVTPSVVPHRQFLLHKYPVQLSRPPDVSPPAQTSISISGWKKKHVVSCHQLYIHSQADSPIHKPTVKNNALLTLRFLIFDKIISKLKWKKKKRLKCQVMMELYLVLIYITHCISDGQIFPWHQFREQAGLMMTMTTGVHWPWTKSSLCPLAGSFVLQSTYVHALSHTFLICNNGCKKTYLAGVR